MKILALEFSSVQRSVAVVSAENHASPATVSEVVDTGERATPAFGWIEAALRQAGLEREQIECLAVGLGPGSYVGIRAAIAIAQGWQLARGTRLVGLSSAEALAAQAHSKGAFGRVAVVIDAQRNEFYLANYEVSSEGWRELRPLRLATLAEVQECEQRGEQLIGPEVTRWFPSGRQMFPRAAILGQLASERTDFVTGEKLEPIYLRATTFVKAPPPRIVPTS